jgi:hypothetical protein
MKRVVKKRPNELLVGDRILGNTNWYDIKSVQKSLLTGVMYPVIEVVDAHGNPQTIETGKTQLLQDHIYEVETNS